MFLHLGEDISVPIKNVIAIIDLTKNSKIIKEFLKTSDEEGFIEKISDLQPKTFILTETNKRSKVYLSPISATTLYKRTNFIQSISN